MEFVVPEVELDELVIAFLGYSTLMIELLYLFLFDGAPETLYSYIVFTASRQFLLRNIPGLRMQTA